MKNYRINVVNFDNEDVIATSHENCLRISVTRDRTDGLDEHEHFHIEGIGFELDSSKQIKFDGTTFNFKVSSKPGHTTVPALVIGAGDNPNWNVGHDADPEDFETRLEAAHFILNGDVYEEE